MKEAILQFASSINLDNCRIKYQPNHIFLCGGALNHPKPSARSVFLNYLRSKDLDVPPVILAEEINNWHLGEEYSDLLTLENDIANLVGVVLLFVESPGSLAELGAFSQLESIRQKFFIVVQSHREREQSFIRLGPIKYMESKDLDSVIFYPWGHDIPGSDDIAEFQRDAAKALLIELRAYLGKKPKSLVFDIDNFGHKMLLVADIINTLVISKFSEIAESMDAIFGSHSTNEIRRFLYMLENIRAIVKYRYGRNTYYISKLSYSYVGFKYKKDALYNETIKWRNYYRENYRENGDERISALEQFYEDTSGV